MGESPARPGEPATIHLDCAAHTYAEMLRLSNRDPRILGDHWCYRWRDEPGWPLARLATSLREYGPAIEQWYGITETVRRHPSTDAAHAYISSLTEAGRPIVVCLDLYQWSRSSFRGLHHYPHRVVISAVRDDEVLVHDGLGGEFVGWQPWSELAVAMSTPELSNVDSWGYDGSNTTVEFTIPPNKPTTPDKQITLNWLHNNTTRHLDGDPPGADVLTDFRVRLAEFAAQGDLGPDFLLPGVAFFGGQASQRHFNALFVEMSAELLDLDLSHTATALHRAARGWNQIYFFFLFGFRKGRPLDLLLTKAAERIDAVAATELEAAEALRKAISAE